MEEKIYELDDDDSHDMIAANEKVVSSKAVVTIFQKMDSKSDRVALAAAEAALRIYGKDQPAKKESTVPFLSCFSKPEQLAGLLQGMLSMLQLTETKEASDVQVEVVDDL